MEQQQKKRKNSKSKGNGFEGQIAKRLSADLAPLNFIRSPGSGARVGGKNFETFGQMFGEDSLKLFVADVVPVNERKEDIKFLHSIECKFYASPDSFTSLVSGSANVFKWFQESVVDAAKIDKNPMLIWKWNHTPIFVAVDQAHSLCPALPNGIKPKLKLGSFIEDKYQELSIFLLDDLLKDSLFWMTRGV